MNVGSVRKSYLYNLIRNISMILFPMVSFPYLSRVLGPEGIGKINFANSIIEYFIMLSALGIPLYGIREVAKVRDHRDRLNRLVNELFQINLICTFVVYIFFFVLLITNSRIQMESTLFLILSLSILFTTFGLEWFYQGIERYEFITKRVIVIRTLSILLMFIFVKTKDDYLIAAGINVIALVGANIYNLLYARKYIDFKLFKKYDLKSHIKPILVIFGTAAAISIYANLDSIMLGFIKGDSAVGYYSVAVKINKLLLLLIVSLSVVLIPRLSYYVENNLEAEIKMLNKKALDIILMISIPMLIGILVLSREIIFLFSGTQFEPSIITMKILSPIIIFISLTNFIGKNLLFSRNKEKAVLYSVLFGAVINFFANLILIPLYSYNGAAIATVFAEFVVLIVQLVYGKNYLMVPIYQLVKLHYITSGMIMGIIVILIKNNIRNIYISTIMSIVIGVISYFFLLILMKDKIISEESAKIIERCKKKYV